MRYSHLVSPTMTTTSTYLCTGVAFCKRYGNYERIRNVSPPSSSLLCMTLTPISTKQFSRLVPLKVTPDQWRSYWGVNKAERLQRVLESVLVSYGGAWLSLFLSYMAGSFVSTLVGVVLIFNWMLTPWFSSNQNNRNIRMQNSVPLRHALFKGRIIR